MRKWWENPISSLNSETYGPAGQERLEMVGTEDYQKKKRSEAIVHIFKGEDFGLPQGWLVERRTRTNPKYFGKIDQLFYQVGSKHKFRSMKSVNNYLNEIQSSNKNDQQPTKNQQRPYHDRAESAQFANIIYDARPTSVYFPEDCEMINLTASITNKIYPFPTDPSTYVDKTSPPPFLQSDHDIPASRSFDINLNSTPFTIDLNRTPFTIDLNSTPFTEPSQDDMNATGSQIPFSPTPSASSSSVSAKQKMKAPSFAFEHQPEDIVPNFYDTEFNCRTSNIGTIFYDTEFNCWTSNIGYSIQDYQKKY